MRQDVDLVIFASIIVPVEPIGEILQNHGIVIKDGKILALLPSEKILLHYNPRETEYFNDHVLIPGLINAHTHASMTLLRGLADDKHLSNWLVEDIWPAESKFVHSNLIIDGTKHAIAEMIKGGTTCFNDMYYYPEDSGDTLEEIGMRGMLGQVVLDFPTCYASSPQDYFKKGREMAQKFKNSLLVKTSISPHSPYTVSDETLMQAEKISKEMNIPFHIHLHETKQECNDSEILNIKSSSCHKSTFKGRPLENFHHRSLLSNRLIAVHMVHLTDEEINYLALDNANVVHCPSSNLKLASGICRLTSLVKSGVNVAIGTDSAASNNTLDMFQELKLASLLAKVESEDATSIPATIALQMATLNGAKALGWDKEIGSLVPGKWADITAVHLDSIELLPLYDVISHLVYVVGRENVSDVWIAGKRVLRDRKLTTIDENQVKESVKKWNKVIKEHHDMTKDLKRK